VSNLGIKQRGSSFFSVTLSFLDPDISLALYFQTLVIYLLFVLLDFIHSIPSSILYVKEKTKFQDLVLLLSLGGWSENETQPARGSFDSGLTNSTMLQPTKYKQSMSVQSLNLQYFFDMLLKLCGEHAKICRGTVS
jgi:hypothetical protein